MLLLHQWPVREAPRCNVTCQPSCMRFSLMLPLVLLMQLMLLLQLMLAILWMLLLHQMVGDPYCKPINASEHFNYLTTTSDK